MKIEITEKQRQELLEFLSRANMRGSEALAFAELVRLIQKAKVDKKDK